MKKHIIILTVLITIGLGSLFLGVVVRSGRIRNTPAPKGHQHEHVQAPSTHTPDSLPVVSGDREKKVTKAKRSTVSTSISIPIPDHQYDQHHDDSQSEKDEEVMVDDEKRPNVNEIDWQEFCMARMRANGWYKPEDVPIIYEPPPSDGNTPDGVYIWRKVVGTGGGPQKLPEHVKARNREIQEELRRASERGDAKEMHRLTKELNELNRPYKSFTVFTMHAGSIPESWMPYFRNILMDMALRQEQTLPR